MQTRSRSTFAESVCAFLHISSSFCLCSLHSTFHHFDVLSSGDISVKVVRSADQTSVHQTTRLSFTAFQTSFALALSPDSSVLHPNAKATVVDANGDTTSFEIDRSSFFSGTANGNPMFEADAAKVGSSWIIHIHTPQEFYAVEPLRFYDSKTNTSHMIAYRGRDIRADNRSHNQPFCQEVSLEQTLNVSTYSRQNSDNRKPVVTKKQFLRSRKNTISYGRSSYSHVVAHEMGHLWGAIHDPTREGTECTPPGYKGGPYLMYPYVRTSLTPNAFTFSPCSRRKIGKILEGWCWYGRCESYCEKLGRLKTPARDIRPCQCTQTRAVMCQQCCQYLDIAGSGTRCQVMGGKLKNGSSCAKGVCINGVCENYKVDDQVMTYKYLLPPSDDSPCKLRGSLNVVFLIFMALKSYGFIDW
ncbi:ADAM 17-like protease [Elysia marginata]|uniref:ADAM 17-like protease n=1 Tax=Elysia marginata TaxID=1093978 RepID=A0AAV4HI15_9GAST|nr:ADAM 17-like protease [Elysia marginata]